MLAKGLQLRGPLGFGENNLQPLPLIFHDKPMEAAMRRNCLISAVVGGALSSLLLSSPAFAQTQPSAPTSAAPLSTDKWMTQEQPGQWRASKLEGLDVYNSNNEKIGDISELLVDNDGKIQAVVIGVGGFLGLGEHDVAVPFDQMTLVTTPIAVSSTATTTAAPTAPSAPATTGAVTSTTRSTTDMSRTAPDHALLKGSVTKEQLKAAPEFKYSR